ncbi:MAG: hypothetical protein M3404_01875 [Actinomycetota bacterium]|nr:hypothetical protein [Actinomycetota bacterium]
MTPAEVSPISKSEQTRRVWTCLKGDADCRRNAPCRSCRGRRNRRSGLAKQRAARKALGVPPGRFHGQMGNEELWLGGLRVEVKSGAQVRPVWTAYLKCETQSHAAKASGDPRPFSAVLMPPGISDGLFVCRLSQLRKVIEALEGQI